MELYNTAALAIAFISLIGSTTISLVGMNKQGKKQVKEDATQLATMDIKLDVIGKDISDIKRDVRDVRAVTANQGERIVKLEQQVKVINRRIFPTEQKGSEKNETD